MNGIDPGRNIMTNVARRSLIASAFGTASVLAMMSAGAAQAVDLDLMISDVDGKARSSPSSPSATRKSPPT